MNKKYIPMKSGGVRKALVGATLLVTAICAAPNANAANLIPANADFESSTVLIPSPLFSWPTTTTWARGNSGLTPYAATTNPQSGTQNAVLSQTNNGNTAYFSLTFVGQPDPLGGPTPSVVDNLAPIVLGQQYQVTFWANRWVDVVAPTDPANMGFVDPASASLPDARITLQLYTTPFNNLSGGGFFGGNLAFNPVAGGTSGAYTQGAWTQYSTTFTADVSGYVELFFKVKDATDTSYFGLGAAGVKYGLDNVSVDAVPEPTTYALLMGAALAGLLIRNRRRH